MAETNFEGTLLFAAQDSENLFGLRELLAAQSYKVYCRDSFVRAVQLLTVYRFDCVVIGPQLTDGTGLTLCRHLRQDANLQQVPVLMLGTDDEQGTTTVLSLDSGANDFVTLPYVEEVLLARIRRLMRKAPVVPVQKSVLSGQTSGDELPGMMQYLETEMKTGRLEVKSELGTGMVYLKEGRLVNALAPVGQGIDAVIELLCWPAAAISFHEGGVTAEDVQLEAEITSVLMNCAVAVDEYKAAKSELPGAQAMFMPGRVPPPDLPQVQARLLAQALEGNAITDLVQNRELGERVATTSLNALIQEGYLIVLDSCFEDYELTCYAHYKSRPSTESRLQETRRLLAELSFPLSAESGHPLATAPNWLNTAPRILIGGDNHEHIGAFLGSLRQLHVALTGRRPAEHKQPVRSPTIRLEFAERAIIDVQALPSIVDGEMLKSLDEYLDDVVGVILMISAQDVATTKQNLRLVRQVRQRFRGVYQHVAARVASPDGRYMFKINCVHCSYKLAVNMDESGFTGECPICGNPITIPDCLDNLVMSLQLPKDMPVFVLSPGDVMQSRDLLVMVIDNIIQACHPPPGVEIPDTRVMRRAAAARQRTPTGGALALPRKIQAAESDELDASATPAATAAVAGDAPAAREWKRRNRPTPPPATKELTTNAPGQPADPSIAGRRAAQQALNLDDILNSDDDIDDFINKIKK